MAVAGLAEVEQHHADLAYFGAKILANVLLELALEERECAEQLVRAKTECAEQLVRAKTECAEQLVRAKKEDAGEQLVERENQTEMKQTNSR